MAIARADSDKLDATLRIKHKHLQEYDLEAGKTVADKASLQAH